MEYVPPDEEAGTEEQWVTRRARRDPALSDPLKLRAVVAANVGENILSHAETDFADAELAVPNVAACGADGVVCAYDACAALLRSLVDAGFALGCTVGDFVPDGEGGGAFTARLEGAGHGIGAWEYGVGGIDAEYVLDLPLIHWPGHRRVGHVVGDEYVWDVRQLRCV